MPTRQVQSYIICTTPRSGSTLLCELLAATGVAGRPGSHFHAPSLDEWLKNYGLDEGRFASPREALRAVLDAAHARGTAGTGVFGLRMQRGSLDHFVQQLGALHPDRMSDVERIEAAFGPTAFIHLSRPDRLGQAISRVRAEQTGLWHRRADGTEMERLASPQEVRYDAGAIARHMAELAALDRAWEDWFAQQALKPLRIGYEALSRDPRSVLAGLLGALGLDRAHAQGIEPPTAKLADATSQEWRAWFEAESDTRAM